MLAHVAKLIMKGYTSGYYPYWNLICDNHADLGEGDLQTLADLVLQGYTSGQFEGTVGYDDNDEDILETIYWSIEYNDDEMENEDGLTTDDLL